MPTLRPATPPAASKRHPPGTILGSYRIEDVLGEGGMGIVYLATHTRLGRRVAIKVLRAEYTDNPQALARFFGEARSVNQLAHQNIIEVTDFVEQPGEDNYYVMELLEGANLSELVAVGGQLDLSRSVAIMTQLAQALAAVHRAGIVHRDVKPQNVILIERGGRADFVKLVDFGAARLVDGSDERLAGSGTILGTPRYMAPEHLGGETVDHRADIYSYGATLYELVTGRPVVAGSDPAEVLAQVRSMRPLPPRQIPGLAQEVPQDLDELIMQCLALDPARRPQDLGDVGDRLLKIAERQQWLVYEPALRPSLVGVPPIAAAPPRRGRARWLIAAIAPLVGAGAVIAWWQLRRVEPPPPPPPVTAASAPTSSVATQVAAELAKADQRIAEGRFVADGGDDALVHLLAARTLDPANAGVHDRLHALAVKYQQLADQALAAGSLPEAAAELQTVISAEPDNAAAAAKMHEVEDQILKQQRGVPRPR